MRAEAAAVLNVAPDHLDWHGSMRAYAEAKGRVYEGCERACVYNVADPETERLVRAADVAEGCRAVGFTLGAPGPGSSASSTDCSSTAPSAPTPGPPPRSWPASTTCSPRRRTPSPTRWPPPRWPGPTASPRPRCGRGCAGSGPTRTGWPWSPGWPRSTTSTTPRPRTGMPPPPRCRRTAPWCGWREAWRRGRRSTSSSCGPATGCAGVVLIGRDRAVLADALARHAPEVPVIEIAEHRD